MNIHTLFLIFPSSSGEGKGPASSVSLQTAFTGRNLDNEQKSTKPKKLERLSYTHGREGSGEVE